MSACGLVLSVSALPCQHAGCFAATVLARERRALPASMRHRASARFAARALRSVDILDVYVYAFGAQSCANRLVFAGSARLRRRSSPRMASSGIRRVAPPRLPVPSVLATVRRRRPPARLAVVCGAMRCRGIPLLASHPHPATPRANRPLPSYSARSVRNRPASSPATRRVSFAPSCGVVNRRLSGAGLSASTEGGNAQRERTRTLTRQDRRTQPARWQG